MKRTVFVLLALTLSLLASGCTKYLDKLTPAGTIAEETADAAPGNEPYRPAPSGGIGCSGGPAQK